jgi:MinD superfamily P-loop ATPase
MEDAVSGEWYVSNTRFGRFVHAKLGVSGENSGKLVTLIRNRAKQEAVISGADYIITDGSPGIGCPVIASVTGADYVLMVAEPTVSGIHDLDRLIKLIGHFGIKGGIVVNRADINRDKTAELEKLALAKKLDFLGKIPVDKNFVLSQIKGLSIMEYADNSTSRIDAARIIEEIWKKITDVLNR